jgi:ABC-type branched-subunit amino acid transport system substrate-binding protein
MSKRVVAIVCALALATSACGSRVNKDELAKGDLSNGTTTAPGGSTPTGGEKFGTIESPCGPAPAGFDATASKETGVSADKIRIGVISDKSGFVKLPTASVEESTKAFVQYCNALGGVNGRKLELVAYDAKLDGLPQVREACNAGLFAIVGSGVVFDDKGAQPTIDCGLVEVPGYTATPAKALADRLVQPLPNPTYTFPTGASEYLAKKFPAATKKTGIISSSGVATAWGQLERTKEAWGKVGYRFVYTGDTAPLQESYSAEALEMKDKGVRAVTMVSATSETVKLLRDMKDQGFKPDFVLLGAQYYDPELLSEPASEGVYVELNTVPFDEASEVPALQQYLDAYDKVDTKVKPTSLGVQSFSAGLLFATAAKAAGEDLTRDRLLEELHKIKEWDGGGLHFKANPGDNLRATCYLILQVKNGKFTRVAPAKRGTFACDPKQQVELTGDYGQGAKEKTG